MATVCDRCERDITLAARYAVWSEARFAHTADGQIRCGIGVVGVQMIPETGGMLLCEKCADGVFTKKNWRRASTEPITLEGDGGGRRLKEARSRANDFAIAVRAKRRGLTPAQARKEARVIGALFGAYPKEAIRRLKSQSRCGNVEAAGREEKPPRARRLRGRVKRCLRCKATVPEGALECAACGSTHYLWENPG